MRELFHRICPPCRCLRTLLTLTILLGAFGMLASQAAPTPQLKIGVAKWAKNRLVIKGNYRNPSASAVELFDASGRSLGTTALKNGRFKFVLANPERPDLLCSVRAQSETSDALKTVRGAAADCQNIPTCKILSPASTLAVSTNADVNFSGQAELKDPAAAPLKMEWDFAGGAMGEAIPGTDPPAFRRPAGANTTVQFVRDNASYKVRFTAWDRKSRYCEDSVMITVGKPPTDLPDVASLAKAAQDGAPKSGSQLAGNKNDIAVLPFPDLTLQTFVDSRYTQNLQVPSTWGPLNALNAIVYRKDRLPVQLTGQDVQLRYSAASNPADPAGSGSINATSQNWPLNHDVHKSAPLDGASIQKTDVWDTLIRPVSSPLASDYGSTNWFSQVIWWTGYEGPVDPKSVIGPDEGSASGHRFHPVGGLPAVNRLRGPFADDHGRYMPGRDQPYASNAPQEFTGYLDDLRAHFARNIPLTDVDDSGRVNPFPLMRVQAVDKQSQQALASVDSVVSAGKDFHCRECHAKGKIAANDTLDWAQFQQAYHSSSEYNQCYDWQPTCRPEFTPPTFYDAVDRSGQPSTSIFDQEYAAVKNASALHDFYDNTGLVDGTEYGSFSDGQYHYDWPGTCTSCHQTLLQLEVGFNVNNSPGEKHGDSGYFPRYSLTMHRYHAQMQRDPNAPDKLLRGPDGRPLRWDPANGPNPNTLFPAVDELGNSLPQEQSCLRCHTGHRDQLYRDRMYTAGVTCYDCHGDMFAVGQAYNKSKPGPGGFAARLEWFEEPDCGSCHTGNANRGKDGANGYVSAGVMKRAFDAADRSATPRLPESQRFAVQAGKTAQLIYSNWVDADYSTRDALLDLSTPLYRWSRDTHGDVSCGACHGGAHEVWPNRDPKANDNITALQLQGHTGNILECNVCHTADSFAKLEDNDGGQYSGDPKPGILGGPHNLHPVNDPYWWKTASGDVANTDGTSYGGWHNNYAKTPGKEGEDQCAACHGNDHKGTRLSKTPVDRVFDFRGFNKAKLKKAGFKSKVIKVAAGTEIGCDTCHSITTSCVGSPAGGQCGLPSDAITVVTNRDPVITSTPGVTTGVMGEAYSYQVAATDPDGDPLTYSLGMKAGSMIMSAQGLVTTHWPESTFAKYHQGPFTFPFTVTVKDSKGGYTTQTITMTLTCPAAKEWKWDDNTSAGSCQPAVQ